MRYGHFDDRAREYVITRPDTPLPWINYLGGEGLCGLISNTAGGYAFYRDARLRRLTRYRYNGVPTDAGGRYLYLRDADCGSIWSPSWQPVRADLDRYHCRHGLGYTVIGSRHQGIACETLYLVPPGSTCEVWRTRVTNHRRSAVELDLVSAVEFCLWDALDDATNLQRNLSIGEVEVVGSVIYHVTEYRERRNHFAYFACSSDLAGFDTDRSAFLGPYRGWDHPLTVEQGRSEGSIAYGWAPIGSHRIRLRIAAGEIAEVGFALGYAENPVDRKFDPPGSSVLAKGDARADIARHLAPGAAAAALKAIQATWRERLERLQVATPSPDTDRMVNSWNPYQCRVAFDVARSASMFETGIARGMGFRDASQDLLGIVHMEPARARARLLELAATQLPSGATPHQVQPLTGQASEAIGSGFHDDPLWLVVAAAAYCKETGDLAILDEPIPYERAVGTEAPLFDHLLRSLGFTQEQLGPHGLPRIGRADWNDCLNLNCFSTSPGESFQAAPNRPGGSAESVFIAGLFCLAAAELANMAERIGRSDDAAAVVAQRQRMAVAIRLHGWDGEWFLRAYDYAGAPVGSAASRQGQCFIEPQGMCVMGGIGLDDGRAVRALDAVAERLASPDGLMLVQPSFTAYDPRLGEITSYPPGVKENGGVFCHTNPWIVIAETMVGNGARAFAYYLRINPSAREALADRHRCEPYVYAQMIAGRDAPVHGEAKNSWLTGSAAWNLVALTQWVLGIRPEHDGLRIDPCLPPDWPGFSAVRRFRGATYHIRVGRRRGAGPRVDALLVDGCPVAGNLAACAEPGRTVHVEAVLGEAPEPGGSALSAPPADHPAPHARRPSRTRAGSTARDAGDPRTGGARGRGPRPGSAARPGRSQGCRATGSGARCRDQAHR